MLSIIGGLFTKQIMYRCVSNPDHTFYISSVRKHAFQKQYKISEYKCPECKKEEKELERQQAALEEERKNKQEAEMQQRLFEKTLHDLQREAQELEM